MVCMGTRNREPGTDTPASPCTQVRSLLRSPAACAIIFLMMSDSLPTTAHVRPSVITLLGLAGARAADVAAAAAAQASVGLAAQPVVPSPPAAPSVNPPPVPPAAPAVPVVARVVQEQHAAPAPPSVAPPKLVHQPSPPGLGAGLQAAELRGAEAAMAANKMPAQVNLLFRHP